MDARTQRILILTGDIDAAGARALAERHFGGWSGSDMKMQQTVADVATRPQLIVVDTPGAGQAAVAVTKGALARKDPLFYQALVANAVLGTGFSSRLNQEIRIKRGLSYGAGSSIDARRGEGPFTAAVQTKNPSAAQVLDLIIAEMKRLGSEPVSAAELDTRKAVLTGSFGRAVETTDGLAGILAGYVMDGVDPAEVTRYQRTIAAVSPPEAQAAAAKLLEPSQTVMVIVGDAKQFLPALRKTHPDVTVIPAASLNLDSPTLR